MEKGTGSLIGWIMVNGNLREQLIQNSQRFRIEWVEVQPELFQVL